MPDFRHITNLATPFDPRDKALVELLSDRAKIGEPLQTDPMTVRPVEQLKADGIIGLYATWEGMNDPEVMHKTGWGNIQLQDWNKLPLMVPDEG